MCHRVRISGFRSAFALILAFVLIGTAADVYAGAGEPPGTTGPEQITGPPIKGVVTLTCCIFDGAVFRYSLQFVGECRLQASPTQRKAVSFAEQRLTTAAAFALFRAADLEFERRTGASIAGCYSQPGGETLIVTEVSNLNNTGTEIGADMSLSVIAPK